uniref:protocadherin gamma-B4-like isoform X2 n=1 Tax=Doryrhamphus excisus TaxID=161450 RepID=UPI0025ADAE1E|nr:protocadherin gamma-B4-like isoform X2 [Doryrhamphus excisus]
MDSKDYCTAGGRWRRAAFLFVFFCFFLNGTEAQIRYSIPEEMKKGSIVGNVAQDLGLDVKRLRSGRARIVTGDNVQYTELRADKGLLVVHERIDREQLCGDVTPCSFTFEILMENPMELHPVTIEVLDVNDNAPTFKNTHLQFEISESAALGSRFVLESAHDADVGVNGLQSYILTPSDHFVLKEHVSPGGSKYAEMVLQKGLDREEQPRLSLKLVAVDGGNPQKSGTVNININILDVNDNVPVFNQTIYKAKVDENAAKGTHVLTVNATDADSGSNGKVTYSFSKSNAGIADLFHIDEETGSISVVKQMDYEKDKTMEFMVEAKDQGALTDSAKVEIEVIDLNDNAPVINVMSFSSPVSEDSPTGTTIGIINVKDLDSGENGHVRCAIEGRVPFRIKSNVRNYFALMTDADLDRESVPEYNITVVASDAGSPPLSSKRTFTLKVSDVNDNAPVFPVSFYTATVAENNSPGVSVLRVGAKDADGNQNARVSYMLEEHDIGGTPVTEFVSVNAESGVISAVRSYDYEQLKELIFIVRAQDGGSPPLSSNVSVRILIQDQNDNAPQVLYPVQTGGSVLAEMVPRSADVGYLVTKVVAVDVDSGQNAWLSYKVHKATDRALFEVGLHNGEIRTVRQVTDKDAVKQRLTVLVEDNGQPSRSATVIVNVAVADSFPEVLSEFTDFSMHDKEYNDKLTFYLVLALAVVSFLFITCLLLIISVKVYRWRRSRILYHSNLPVIPYYPPRYSDTLGTGTLPHVYNYEVCRTTDSRKSDVKNMQGMSQSLVSVDGADADTPHVTKQLSGNCSQMSTLEHVSPGGSKYAEMVLQKGLDREEQPRLSLKLVAVDGGNPQRSGTVNININILDINDNAPVFNQTIYKAKVDENAAKGTKVLTVNATDADSGSNGKVTYSFSKLKSAIAHVFHIDEETGIISVVKQMDYEKDKTMEFMVEAKDQGGLTESTKVEIEVIDLNDNAPVINVMSFSSPVSEDSPTGTTIGIINVKDLDSGENGHVRCAIEGRVPFKIKSNVRNYFALMTDADLDRESVPEYNITVVASDAGSPPLSSKRTFTLKVSDVNDNAPVFPVSFYTATVAENNSPGVSVLRVGAKDADGNQNARVSYMLEEHDIGGTPVTEFVSVNAESGVISAVRSYDYEQLKELIFIVRAQDGGSPPLSSNVSVRILIQDQNDNAPQVLYPVQTGGSVLAEMVPRSADVGYLVTKVVAVDVDSGQNAWLSYKVHKATDRALFEVGLHNGEIRTVRQVTDKDAVKQRLTVLVEDNGQPSRSATVIVNVAVADSFPEVLSEFTDFSMHDKEYNDKLTFYLVLALAVVSFLFITCLLLIISVKVYRWRRSRILYHSNLPVIPYYPPRYSDTLGTGTLPHVYNYEVCRTTDSRKSDMKNMQGMSQSLVSVDGADADTPHVTKQLSGNCSQMSTLQKPPNNDWRFNQGQRPGPSGAAGGPEVAMGTGPWPQPPTEAEQLQALMAAANVGEATGTLGPGTMGLSTRYSPQFTLQHVPDYRQNVYIPGSTATLTSNPQQQQQQAMAQQASQQALPPPQSGQPEPPKAAQTPASKKKSTKKEKK